MIRFLVVSALLKMTEGVPKVRSTAPLLDGRIIGGNDCHIMEVPYQLSLESHGKHLCGGCVLSASRALTAAHCVDGAHPVRFKIRAGSSLIEKGGQLIQVESFSQHPKYNSRMQDYDVSILKLSSPLKFGTHVKPIALHAVGSELPDGALAVASGWGILSNTGLFSPLVRKVEVPKVSDETCKKSYGESYITDRMTCHGYEKGGKDACLGDSGGPLVVNGTLVGVVSWGYGCAVPGYPGVYAKITNSEIYKYIQQ